MIARIEKATAPLLIITDHARKEALLERMREARLFHPVRFLNAQELTEHVFFRLDDAALFEAARFLDRKAEVVEPLLSTLYFIDMETDYDGMLKTLQSLKRHLLDKDLIRRPATDLFATHDIVVHGPLRHPVASKALARLESTYGVERIPLPAHEKEVFIHNAETIEEEIADIACRMRRLHEDGVPFSRMALVNAHRAYRPYVRRLFTMFSIPYSDRRAKPLISHPLARTLRDALQEPADSFYKALEHAKHRAEQTDMDLEAEKVLSEALSILNPLVRFDGTLQELLAHAGYLLDTHAYQPPALDEAVIVTSFDKVESHIEHVFLVGAHEGYFPAQSSTVLPFSEPKRDAIGYPLKSEFIEANKQAIFTLIDSVPHVDIHVSRATMDEQFIPSYLLEEIRARHHVREASIGTLYEQPYSETFDALTGKAHFDRFSLYGEKSDTLLALYPTFKDRFASYDNRFTLLSEETYAAVFPGTLNLSYTRLNSFFACPFRFLLERFDLEPSSDTFALDIGNAFHRALERRSGVLDDETIDTSFSEAFSGRTLTAREAFFVQKAKKALKRASHYIAEQEERTLFEASAAELPLELSIKDNVTLRGVIDRLFSYENYRAILDYKSKKPSFNLHTAYHGLNAQLFFYAYLYRALYPHTTVSGFYEQTIFPGRIKREKNKTRGEILEAFHRLKGYTIADQEVIRTFDPGADERSFIKGLDFTKNGKLKKRSKVYTEETFEALLGHFGKLLEEAVESIARGDFPIEVKRRKRTNESCTYCDFSDICFKTSKDVIDLEVFKDDEALIKTLKKGDA